jgi:hypothetical protein
MPAASFFDFLIGHQTLLRRAGRTRLEPGPSTVRNLHSRVPGLASGLARDDKRADGSRPQGPNYQRREE